MSVSVLVLLFALVKRFSVSHTRNFFLSWFKLYLLIIGLLLEWPENKYDVSGQLLTLFGLFHFAELISFLYIGLKASPTLASPLAILGGSGTVRLGPCFPFFCLDLSTGCLLKISFILFYLMCHFCKSHISSQRTLKPLHVQLDVLLYRHYGQTQKSTGCN